MEASKAKEVPASETEIKNSSSNVLSDLYQDVDALFPRHLRRQAMILKASSDADLDVLTLAKQLEESIFTPKERKVEGDPDPKLNFYPPFLTPECLALHFPFFLNLPIPRSCKANRIGSKLYEQWKVQKDLQLVFPDPATCKWNDALGAADTIAELKDNQKFALLKNDSSRASWFKSKALGMTTFAYPSIALPPALQKLLIELFIGKSQEPNALDQDYVPALTDSFIVNISPKLKPEVVRENAKQAVVYGVLMHCLNTFFSSKVVIKNLQEALHYTFNHGFVKLIHLLTDCNLSDFVTFHGLTHRNRLNNPLLQTQLAGDDKYDYILDSVYLFLVFTWQTAMDIWQQTLDGNTLKSIEVALGNEMGKILRKPSSVGMAEHIAGIIFPPLMVTTFQANLPDFINQTQLQNFRTFICLKSGVPQAICPLLPSDCVPLTFKESHPILWGHVLLLNLAAFVVNHGDYMKEVDSPVLISSCMCDCNLCSPHRMPCYNAALMQEILTIGKFEFQEPPDESGKVTKSLKLTPQTFANAYLRFFSERDFFFDTVQHYKTDPSEFKDPLQACVIKNTKLLATLRETQIRREKELLKRGSGVYLDPDTGEPLALPLDDSEEDCDDLREGKAIHTDASVRTSTAGKERALLYQQFLERAQEVQDDDAIVSSDEGIEEDEGEYQSAEESSVQEAQPEVRAPVRPKTRKSKRVTLQNRKQPSE
ncbi:100K protein [Duck adenovirus 1]|uniref:100K protein n=1 Tax=Duck adenovirus 1 TaxID=130329 RepID=S5RHB2_DADV1|nr:100K protein [Duck adenovirus 1]AJA72336.1 100K protein [Duck adenovirus 1]AJA72365.1 100K protein [Duck adenovirus 1]WPT09548.1 100K protein [Duck adenovirus 1]